MPKKQKYPWDAKRQEFRKQVKYHDGTFGNIYAKTEREMDDKLSTHRASMDLQLQIHADPTVVQYCKKWFDLLPAELSPARRQDHKRSINKYICPAIGNKKMKKVIASDGKAIIRNMDGMSKSAQDKVASALRQIFDAAEEDGIIVRSPFRKLKSGGYETEEKTPLTDEQSARLLRAVKGTRAERFITIALYTGMRREEICGLRWPNVHLDDDVPYIAVRERITFHPETGAAIHEKELKSRASNRNLPIPQILQGSLRAAKAESKSEFVVPKKNGDPMSKQSLRKLWDIVTVRTIREESCEDLGKPVMQELGSSPTNHSGVVRTLDFACTPHLLRHTYITNLCKAGVNIKRIQYLAGHATVQITLNIYAHVLGITPDELVDDVEGAMSAYTQAEEEKAQNTAQNVIQFTQSIAAQRIAKQGQNAF